MLGITYNASAILPFLQAALSRRVDIGLCSDSNTCKDQVSGHNCGMRKAFASRFGQYATGLLGQAGVQADGLDCGQSTNQLGTPFVNGANSGSPTALENLNINNFVGAVGVMPVACSNWMYAATGTLAYNANQDIATLCGVQPPITSNATSNNGMILVGNPMDLTQELSWEFTYGTFGSGAGYFTPTAHQSGNATVVYSTGHYATSATEGFSDGKLIVPAGARNQAPAAFLGTDTQDAGGVAFSSCDYNNSTTGATVGPVLFSYNRVQAPGVTSGVAYSTLTYQGGQGARMCALTWQAVSQAAATELFRQLTRLQTGSPMLMIQVIQGGNDLGDTNNSVGPSPQPSDTPAGFADNLTAIIQRLSTLWTTAGNSAANLFFMFGPYHPQLSRLSTTLTWQGQTLQELVAYEEAAMSVAQANARCCVVRGSQLMPSGFQQSATYLQAKGYYDYQGDAHLVRQGYDFLGQRAIDAICSESGVTGQAFPLANYTTGQTVVARGYDTNSGVLIQSITLTESPAGTGRYTSNTPFVVVAPMDIQYVANGVTVFATQQL